MPAIAFKVRGGATTYVKRDGKVGTAGKGALTSEEVAFTLAATQDQQIYDGYVVRRLTPLECERLQGMPDGHTDIPWRGKEHAPDSRRYKAIGNSMAVPVMKWIGERIELVERVLGEQDD
jgi:DNA (cytosine-5)-methyltransferase 1